MDRVRLNLSRLVVVLLLAAGCPGSEGMMMMPGPPGPEPEPPVTPLVFPDEPFRAGRPAPAPTAAFQFPRPETFALPNGIKVFLVERRTVPNVSWYVTFPGGGLLDPPGKTGLASLCLNVSFQGSTTLTRQDRDQALADMSSFVDLGATSDTLSWSGEALQPHLGATAGIWMDLFLAPLMSQAYFDGTQRARVSTLSAGPSQTPAAISSRVASRLYWGREHPFNRVITGATLMQVTLPDCQDLFRRLVQPVGAKLFVSGAINRAEVMTAFQRLGAWTGTAGVPPMILPPPPAAPVPGRVFFVHAAGAPQSIITIRGKGPARSGADYLAAEMMASILAGDSISSRIGLNVREMRGYAYSLGGGFSYTLAGGAFTFSAPVRADVTGESVFEVLEEIRKLREGGVTTEELERERRFRLAGLPYSFETARATNNQFQFLDVFGVPFDHFDNFAGSVGAVTAPAVQQAATSYLALDGLQVLVVGDAGQALAKLRSVVAMRPDVMGAEVTVVDSEGNPSAAP